MVGELSSILTHIERISELDLEESVAVVHRDDPDYSTSAREVTDISIVSTQERRSWGGCELALGEVGADLFRRLGMEVDFRVSDWGTLVQRRASREPPGRGGWL